MARFKDFGSGNQEELQEISFKLYGEEFKCRSGLQGKILLNLVAKSANENDPAAAAEAINYFFKSVLLDESYDRFNALTDDPDRLVNVETLTEIVGWLVEQYTDRPTKRPELSSSGE